ncbi:MAG: ABC transporter permease [Chloroherpetonaceae bacterium]|nr:ABC transporter permease [Chloroherpetonaceae bacterium]
MKEFLLKASIALGEGSRGSVRRFMDFILFSGEVFRQFLVFYDQKQVGFIVLLRQILFTGYEALKLIALISFAIGGIIILQGNSMLSGFSQSPFLYTLLVTVIVRELSCLITGIIIIARSGTAIATELGNMVINREIDALLSIGISPISYLVVPRAIGVVVALVTLTVYFNMIGILSAWLVSAVVYPVDIGVFLSRLAAEIKFSDIIASIIKSLCFGLMIALISCYQGLQVNFASTEVPQRTIKAVVQSLTWMIILDVIIDILIFF